MEYSGRYFIASLEEDDEQKSLFRVRPLLDETGLIQQEELEELGDEGYLRIVPDKQEQYSFKERMRTLGQLCMLDLRDVAPEAHKVRQNKNYSPSRGESNRYVLYSDTVKPIEGLRLYEVLSDRLASSSLTPAYYLRKGGHIHGPFDRHSGEAVDALSCIAPDSDRLFSLALPDEREHLFFWPEPDASYAPALMFLEESGSHASEKPEAPAVSEAAAPIQSSGFAQAAEALAQYLEDEGFACDTDEATAVLLQELMYPGAGLQTQSEQDAALAQEVILRLLEGGRPAERRTLPQMPLMSRPGFPQRKERRPGITASRGKLIEELNAQGAPISEEGIELLNRAENCLLECGLRLPLKLKQEMSCFISLGAQRFTGSEPMALDYALRGWLLPFCGEPARECTALLEMLSDSPLCRQWLESR